MATSMVSSLGSPGNERSERTDRPAVLDEHDEHDEHEVIGPQPTAATPSQAGAPADARATSALFDRVYDEHVDFVWRSAVRLGISSAFADDVVQQTFLVVHRRLAEFEGRSSYKTWIFSILHRTVRDHRRSMRRKSPHWFQRGDRTEPDALTASQLGPFEELEKARAARLVGELLDTLDDDERTVFVLAELEGMSANEIAEAVGTSPKWVYSRLRAARTSFERAAARARKNVGRWIP